MSAVWPGGQSVAFTATMARVFSENFLDFPEIFLDSMKFEKWTTIIDW